MKVLVSFIAVLLLALIAYAGVTVANAQFIFGVVIPYAAFLLFVGGMILRVLKWASSPVPFRIPTTCGQQKSLPWIKQSKLENPSGMLGVIGRMALEVFFFRSLFRNLKTQMNDDQRLTYGEAKWLWVAGMAFHWSFLVILIRHLRFFMTPVPEPIQMISALDSFLQIGTPLLYMTDVVLLAAVTYLFIRRVTLPQVRYISLIGDYFPLFLILGIGMSGVLMRYFIKTDIVSVKVLTMGLISFSPRSRAASASSSSSICSSSPSCSPISPSASWSTWPASSSAPPATWRTTAARRGTSIPGTIRSMSIPMRSMRTTSGRK